jgi:uncharacterized protein (UPF0248 family)
LCQIEDTKKYIKKFVILVSDRGTKKSMKKFVILVSDRGAKKSMKKFVGNHFCLYLKEIILVYVWIEECQNFPLIYVKTQCNWGSTLSFLGTSLM